MSNCLGVVAKAAYCDLSLMRPAPKRFNYLTQSM